MKKNGWKLEKLRSSPDDSPNAAGFQGCRLSEGKALSVTRRSRDVATIVYNQNNNKSRWISCRVFMGDRDPSAQCVQLDSQCKAGQLKGLSLPSVFQANLLRCSGWLFTQVWLSRSSRVIYDKSSCRELDYFSFLVQQLQKLGFKKMESNDFLDLCKKIREALLGIPVKCLHQIQARPYSNPAAAALSR